LVRFGEANSANAVEYRSDTPGGRLAFEIFQVYRDRGGRAASGKFSAILRNRRDPNDRTALYIMDGSFITGVRN
jgi:hypothetical protein